MAGLGHFGKQMQFGIFLPRGPHDTTHRAAWIERVLRGLWEHGATFDAPPQNDQAGSSVIAQPPLQWENMLATSPATAHAAADAVQYFDLEKAPLRACITQMAQVRSSTLRIYGTQILFFISFDFAVDAQASPEEAALLADPLKRYGVNPYVDRLKLTSRGPIGPGRLDDDDVSSNQENYVAAYEEFWQWCVLACELTSPIFGLGYSDYDLTARGLDEHDQYYRTGGQELLAGQLPDMDALFTHVPARYLAPEFPPDVIRDVTAATLNMSSSTAIQVPGVVHQLATRGILVRPGDPFFTAEAERAFIALRQASVALARLRRLAPDVGSRPSPEQLQQALQRVTASQQSEGRMLGQMAREQALQARNIFQSVGETKGVQSAQATINEAEWLEKTMGIREQSYP